MGNIFLDIETTGLDCDDDQITEIAWIDAPGREHQYFVKHTKLPNEWVLKNTDYATRILPALKYDLSTVLEQLINSCNEARCYGSHDPHAYIVGACIAFDDRFLRKAFKQCFVQSPGVSETPYHYHVIDVEAMAMGYFGWNEPKSLSLLRKALGMPGENEAPHSALHDAREVKLIFEAIQKRALAYH